MKLWLKIKYGPICVFMRICDTVLKQVNVPESDLIRTKDGGLIK